MENNNLKRINKNFIIISAIVLSLTLILGLIFIFNMNSDFVITKTILGEMTSSIDGNNPGAGGLLILSLFVSGLTFLGEIALLIIVAFMFFIIPVGANIVLLIINTIARLFQIGEYRNWKNITTKVLLYLSTILQGILNVYLLFLCFSGFDLLYIVIYFMLIVNIFGFIKNIINLRNIKILLQNNY